MLINLCDEFLKTRVKCDTISTEGYEIENLINNCDNGFLAYSCIRPPVNIDFTFNCFVKINHIIIWPTIGAQKSSGFRVLASSGSDDFQNLSSYFFKPSDTGVTFCRSGGDKSIGQPGDFSRSFMSGRLSDRVKCLRISIVKTEKSVPAIKRIQVWGCFSMFNDKECLGEMNELVMRSMMRRESSLGEEKRRGSIGESQDEAEQTSTSPSLTIPESFLDPITFEIMQQPVVLPSGKVIDQRTLEKYAESQALWGRAQSDPFTGVPFSDSHRPVFASTLKAMIDKFLSENSDSPEIKSLPRLLGTTALQRVKNNPLEIRRKPVKTSTMVSQSIRPSSVTANNANKLPVTLVMRRSTDKHRTPIVAQYSRDLPRINSEIIATDNQSILEKECDGTNPSTIDDNLENNLQTVLSRLKRFNNECKEVSESSLKDICTCCDSYTHYYKLPCNHVVCRKILITSDNPRCNYCGVHYKSSQIERINL